MIDAEQLRNIAQTHMGEGGIFVYDKKMMQETAQRLLNTDMPYGLTVRYAAKANRHPEIIRGFNKQGLHFDASSPSEAMKLLELGIDGKKISLSSQILSIQSPDGLKRLSRVIESGVLPVAVSALQVTILGELGVKKMAIRLNPGEGSGHSNRVNVGGPSSSFGIWKDQRIEVKRIAEKMGIEINRIHTHIGSGADPSIWGKTIQNSLAMVEDFPDVTTLDIGGGYKIARMPDEKPTDMDQVMGIFASELEKFKKKTGRKIHLEIEPGTWLVGNAGTLLARVEDITATTKYTFIKLNVGMNANMRPAMYGAQHPIEVLSRSNDTQEYVVAGPCCESGDILTPEPGNPEEIKPRLLKKAVVGDFVSIGGTGAYCASMCALQYNDIPPPTDYFV